MSELMKGNFDVKRKLDVPDVSDDSADFKNEFKKKRSNLSGAAWCSLSVKCYSGKALKALTVNNDESSWRYSGISGDYG